MANPNLNPVKITLSGDFRVVHVGDMEIWDGADLALFRDTLTRLVEQEGCRSIGIDMRYVKFVPSGFFGMLYQWCEKGVCIRVFGPLSNVKRMLWFTMFFQEIGNDWHELRRDPNDHHTDDTLTPRYLFERSV